MHRVCPALLVLLALVVCCEGEEFKKPLGKLELGDTDTLVFLGDSITHQCLYTQYVEDFFYTRYPHRKLHFHNAGVGGDQAQDALDRFDEDVAKFKPKYVTILLGMNDGGYNKFLQQRFDTYEKNMTRLLERIEQAGSTAVLMSPTIYDTRARELQPNYRLDDCGKYYNSVLAFYGTWLYQQATAQGLGFVDMHSTLGYYTMQGRRDNPRFTMIPDAVHPGPAGQAVMAMAILLDMNAEHHVSSISAHREGTQWSVSASQDDQVSDTQGTGQQLTFTHRAASLPWVLPPEANLGYEMTEAGDVMNEEVLEVSGLAPGEYELQIDGKPIDVFSHTELAAGIPLLDNDAPQCQQAMEVVMLNKERNDKAVRPLRDAWGQRKGKRGQLAEALRKAASDTEKAARQAEYDKWQTEEFRPKVQKLLAAAQEYEDKIYQANQPKPHKIALTPSKSQ